MQTGDSDGMDVCSDPVHDTCDYISNGGNSRGVLARLLCVSPSVQLVRTNYIGPDRSVNNWYGVD